MRPQGMMTRVTFTVVDLSRELSQPMYNFSVDPCIIPCSIVETIGIILVLLHACYCFFAIENTELIVTQIS